MKHITRAIGVLLIVLSVTNIQAQGKWDSLRTTTSLANSYPAFVKMYSFKGTIYAGTLSNDMSVDTGSLYSSVIGDTGSWKVESSLYDLIKGTATTAVMSLGSTTSGSGFLFAGTNVNGAQPGIFRNDGTSWINFSPPSFNSVPSNYQGVSEFCAFSTNGLGDSIYAGLENPYTGAELYVSPAGLANPDWKQVLAMPVADGYANQFTGIKVFHNKIYACTNGAGYLFQSDNGLNWTRVLAPDSSFHDQNVHGFTALEVFNNELYLAGSDYINGASLYKSADGITWTVVSHNGFGLGGNYQSINDLHAAGRKLWTSGMLGMPSIVKPTGTGISRGPKLNANFIHYSSDGMNYRAADSTGFNQNDQVGSLADMNYKLYYGGAGYAGKGGQIWRTCMTPAAAYTVPSGPKCSGAAMTLANTSTGALNYMWTINGVHADSVHTSFNYQPTTAGTYTVGLKAFNANCVDSSSHVIVVNQTPSLNAGGGRNLCLLDTAKLIALVSGGTKPYTYSWSNGSTHDTISVHPANSTLYTATVTDQLGCSNKDTLTVHILSLPVVSLGKAQSACKQDSITLMPSISGGRGPYTFLWNTTQKTPSIRFPVTANQLYSVVVTDQNGCHQMDTSTVHAFNLPTVNLGGAQITCTTDTITLKPIVGGGSAPFSYSWCSGANTDSILISITSTASYTVTVSDQNGCMGTDSMTVHVVPHPTISGTVTSSASGNINAGFVYLVYYNALPEKQFIVDTVPIVNGTYSVSGFHDGNYLIFAKANPVMYPNAVKTYSFDSATWVGAKIVTAPCNTSVTANINIIELTPLVTGIATLSGNVAKGPGFGVTHRFIPSVGVLGEPIPGLDVNLEQHPGGIIAHDTTDALGNYSFTHVPVGTYSIYVDIPGLGLISQYTIGVSPTTNIGGLNYTVDSTHIYKDTLLIVTSVKPVSAGENSLVVSPNPFKDLLNISYTLKESSQVTLQIYNVLGEEITSIVNHKQDAGVYNYHLDSGSYKLSQGMFLLKMTIDGKVISRRLLSLH
jgi:hypothetical protein